MEKRLLDPTLPSTKGRRARVLSLLTLGCIREGHADVDSRTLVDSSGSKVVDEYALPICGPVIDPLSRSAYSLFLQQFPEYPSTSVLDEMRRREYKRLDESGETYVDYMGDLARTLLCASVVRMLSRPRLSIACWGEGLRGRRPQRKEKRQRTCFQIENCLNG